MSVSHCPGLIAGTGMQKKKKNKSGRFRSDAHHIQQEGHIHFNLSKMSAIKRSSKLDAVYRHKAITEEIAPTLLFGFWQINVIFFAGFFLFVHVFSLN